MSAVSRDRDFERLAGREILASVGVDPEPLIQYACARADAGAAEYGYDFPALDRDLELAGLQEGSDWHNYLLFRLDGIRRGLFPGQEWKIPHLQAAMRAVAVAFHHTQEAREP